MSPGQRNHSRSRGDDRLVRRLAKMVGTGHISEQDAERVRSVMGSDDFSQVVEELRLGHIKERIDQAVEAGRLTRPEADALIDRVRDDQDPRSLPELRRALHRGPEYR